VKRRPRSRTLRALNPIRAFTMAAEDSRIQKAIDIARRDREGLPEDDSEWFGWPLPDEPRHRYVAVGVDTHGFVVDVVSGHIMWQSTIDGPRRLPRSIADTASKH
jgi:hypothetical protein